MPERVTRQTGAPRRGFFRDLATLTAMQLKEKMDLGFLRSKRKTLFKTVWLLVEFIAVTAICYLAIFALKLLSVFSLVGDLPDTVMTVVFTFMMLLSLLFGTAGLIRSLYFSRDNMVLLTYPVKPTVVFLSKLAVYYVYEFRKNFMFTIPLFIGYGLSKHYPFYFYPWLLVLFVFISALPVILSALLSIPGMFLSQWIRKVKFLQYLLYVLFAAVAVGVVLFLISLIPANIDLLAEWGTIYWRIQDFLKNFCNTFPFMLAFVRLILGRSSMYAVRVFTGQTLPHLAFLVGLTVLLLGACFLFSRPLFYKMASKPFEYAKKAHPKEAQNRRRGGFFSALRKEIVIGLRSNSLITVAVVLDVVMPIAIHLLNKLYSAMNTRYLGTQMTVAFNLLIMLLILLAANIDRASCYSRDGAASYLNKIQPTPFVRLLVAKLCPYLLIGLFGTGLTVAVYAIDTGAKDLAQPILLGLTAYGFYVAHLFWSAEMDIMRPQYAQYATFNEQANNPNENMSALLVFVLSFVAFIVALLLSLKEGMTAYVKIAVIAAVLAIGKIFTYFMKIKVFYKEKN